MIVTAEFVCVTSWMDSSFAVAFLISELFSFSKTEERAFVVFVNDEPSYS